MFLWLADGSKPKEYRVLKQILVIAGGLVLAVSLPLTALAFATDRTPALGNVPVGASDDAPQPTVQQRLRVHAETGPPEGFVPARQRLHQPDGFGPDERCVARQQQVDGFEPGQRNMVGREQAGGAVCTGECPNDGEPSGAGNGRSGGAGQQGPYGQDRRGKG